MNNIYSSTQPIQCTHAVTLTVDTPLGVTEVQVEAHHNGSLINNQVIVDESPPPGHLIRFPAGSEIYKMSTMAL
jgi:hypothetical protein